MNAKPGTTAPAEKTYRVTYHIGGADLVRIVTASSALLAYRLTEAIPGAHNVGEPEVIAD